MSNPPEREIGSELSDAMRHSTGSYELVIAAIAAAGLGFWIDSVIGIVPVFTLIFAIAGFVGAGYSIYLKYQEKMATENADRTARSSSKNSSGATA
ncbi:MAG: AtpZ/AtpI family protein [Acidimicrobiaceae bacterium]|nr:AtpZ/AtpI family protein [bacterium]MCO4832206.1 AtpZ/AtpI family protein [Acidimicrobiaceae bacterium]MDB4102645.1 AtpZ/AtpI family protein [Acidimicrobiales bacterium]MDA8848317.1 AtpZ/AtpI family protein [bacterium]MDB9845642.1 AtpZ/AtpI family protein [Acidimicrobiales bacterium]